MSSQYCESRAGRAVFVGVAALFVVSIAMRGFTVSHVICSLRPEPPVSAEMQMLTSAMKSYREWRGAFPPCMGASSRNDRDARFNEHLRKAYRRCMAGSYSAVRQAISAGEPAHNFRDASGLVRPLDLDTLDQAEALVFWLAGFPGPVDAKGKPIAPKKLIGFDQNPATPFALRRLPDEPWAESAKRRRPPLFDFDESRLTDHDNDGWLEYVPPTTTGQKVADMPPYVYFDSALYRSWQSAKTPSPYSGYPIVGAPGGNAKSAQLRDRWGLAVPYAVAVPSGPEALLWINPMGLQIIAAGDDLRYCSRQSATQLRIPMYPSGMTYYERDQFSNPSRDYDPGERDNLTNFAPGTLEEQRNK